MKFFTRDMTLEQIKIAYRKLCKEFHPDLHTPDLHTKDTAFEWVVIMQAINAEYAVASANARRTEEPAKRAKYGKAEPTHTEYEDMAAVDERVRAAIEKIITLNGIEIEICGLWVWVSGDTKRVKDSLMAAGYKWASKKVKWYYAGVPASSFGHWDMDKIRTRYGSTKVNHDDDTKTTAKPAYVTA